ncbi:hypothetical protein [Nocardia jejuensis]|uniref:hypothetical protein n=1 Tax=Nocardia jejuensis TaxID=328049 RepID=UPI000AFF3E6C|nr:hypothetical protein [Nocardia jejuensis]
MLATDLIDRGHRWVRVRPIYLPHLDPASALFGMPEFSQPELEGWWQVRSVVDELAIDDDAADHQRGCEHVAAVTLARSYCGFLEGGSMAHRETLLRHLNLDGLLHDLPQEDAYEQRGAVTRSFPPPRDIPAPTIAAATPARKELPPLLDTVRAVATRLDADGAATPRTNWWLTDDAEQFEDDQEVLSCLSDAVLYQGTCSPDTAEQIPLLAGIIEHEHVSIPYRAYLVLLLGATGTVGRRLAAQNADRRSALGLGSVQSPDETAAQKAVETVASSMLRRWPTECDAVRNGLAFLAAAFPSSAHTAGVVQSIAEAATTRPEHHQATMLRLAHAVASAHDAALHSAYSAAIASTPIELTNIPSPVAPATAAGLEVLHRMLELETNLVLKIDARDADNSAERP